MTSISYLVCVRNMEETIGRCLVSLVNETPDEIIVVDGRSTDATSRIVSAYNVTHLFDSGRSLAAARNIGVRACKSDYVVMIDADQWIEESFDCELKSLLTQLKCDLVICKERWVGHSLWALARQATWTEIEYLKEGWIQLPRVFKREQILRVGGYEENFVSMEDREILARIRRLSPKIVKADLTIYSDARDTNPLGALRDGIWYYAPLVSYVARHPNQWRMVLSIAPIGFALDLAIAAHIALAYHSLKLGVASAVLRISMTLGRTFGAILGTPLGMAFYWCKPVRDIIRI